jgi:hypothetical protein
MIILRLENLVELYSVVSILCVGFNCDQCDYVNTSEK